MHQFFRKEIPRKSYLLLTKLTSINKWKSEEKTDAADLIGTRTDFDPQKQREQTEKDRV